MNLEMDYNERVKHLLEILETDSYQIFDNYLVGLKKNGRVEVRGFSVYHRLSEITEILMRDELEKVKENFTQLINTSHLLAEQILKAGIDYSLNLDYGGGSIQLCAEIDGKYEKYI